MALMIFLSKYSFPPIAPFLIETRLACVTIEYSSAEGVSLPRLDFERLGSVCLAPLDYSRWRLEEATPQAVRMLKLPPDGEDWGFPPTARTTHPPREGAALEADPSAKVQPSGDCSPS